MDEVDLNKDAQESEEETPQRVSISVYSDTHHTFPIELGFCTKAQVESIHVLVRSAFETLSPSRGLTFVDQAGTTRHFNTDHVCCVEVRVR